ncbi:MAG: imidazolonepropionase [Armatimonadetes bacterium]|nr:imidazolonepropionase [Armatimonadota bacterium]
MPESPDFVVAPIAELHTVRGGARRGVAMSETGRIADGGLAISTGRVLAVGRSEEIISAYPDWPRRSGRLVTPGLVDCHTHIVWGGDRSDEFLRRCRRETYQEIAAAGGGILSTMRATRSASVEELADGIVSRAETMLASGTTCLEIKASYGPALDGCRKELDAIALARTRLSQRIALTFMGGHALPPELSRSDFLRLLTGELIPMAAAHPAACSFNDVFCEEGAFTVAESEEILQAGLRHGLAPKIHSDEFAALGGTQMACSLGAVSCDHLLASGPAELRALAESDTVAVTMPGTALYLGKAYADGRKMVDEGCIVALGTDFNPGSSMVSSMAFVMGLAVAKMGLSPAEALAAATTNAARAIRMDAGSLEVGSVADFCSWPCDSLEQLIYQFTFIRPDEVSIAGSKAAKMTPGQPE